MVPIKSEGEEINLLSSPALRDADGEEKNFLRHLTLRFARVAEGGLKNEY